MKIKEGLICYAPIVDMFGVYGVEKVRILDVNYSKNAVKLREDKNCVINVIRGWIGFELLFKTRKQAQQFLDNNKLMQENNKNRLNIIGNMVKETVKEHYPDKNLKRISFKTK